MFVGLQGGTTLHLLICGTSDTQDDEHGFNSKGRAGPSRAITAPLTSENYYADYPTSFELRAQFLSKPPCWRLVSNLSRGV